MVSYVPDRGDVVWLSFDPQLGHEQSGRRPAFVISPKSYNEKVGLGLFCPITSQIKGYPFEVLLPENINISGVVLCDQIKSFDWKVRQAELIYKLPKNIINEIISKIKTLID